MPHRRRRVGVRAAIGLAVPPTRDSMWTRINLVSQSVPTASPSPAATAMLFRTGSTLVPKNVITVTGAASVPNNTVSQTESFAGPRNASIPGNRSGPYANTSRDVIITVIATRHAAHTMNITDQKATASNTPANSEPAVNRSAGRPTARISADTI